MLIHSGDIIGGHYYCFVRLPPGMEPCLTKREPTDTTSDDEKTEDEEGEDAVSGMDEEDESGEESEGSHEDEANKPPKNHTDRCWKWYKFDDDIVTKVRPEEALGDAFGGAWGEVYSDSGGDTSSEGGSGDEGDAVYETGDGDTLKRKVVGRETEGGDRPGSKKRRKFEAKKKTSIVGDWKRQKTSNAYMLVYVRESELETIMGDINVLDIPKHLSERFKIEREKEKRRTKYKLENAHHIKFRILTRENIFMTTSSI